MQYFEQSNENMEVELQLIILLLSFYSTRHMIDIIQHAYSF